MSKLKITFTFLFLLALSVTTSLVSTDNFAASVIPSGLTLQTGWFGSSDRLERLDLLSKVLAHVRDNYVEPNRIQPQEMFKKALDEISQTIAEVRVVYPEPNRAVLMVDEAKMEFDTQIKTLYALQSSISDALKFVRDHKKSEFSDKDFEIEAVQGVLSTLDPHSVYLSTENFTELKVGNTGTFGGLGLVIGIRNAKLTIIAPLAETPAARAGLKAGDYITKIGDETTVNMSLNEAVNKMRGPRGTSVVVAIMREGWTQEKSYSLIRDNINVVSVDSKLLPHGIGYVRVKNFQEKTARDLNKHLHDLAQENHAPLTGLVLDLRNDPGGLLDQAIAVTDKFLDDGPIVTTVGSGNRVRDQEKATGPGTEPNYPMAVLVDQGSASASEIVAGALKRRDRAIVIGQRTFGKGTVQSLFALPEESALKLTIAQYLTPGDVSIQSVGIQPDIHLQPQIISKDLVDLYRKKYFEGEVSLERHFDNPNVVAPPKESSIEMKYLETLENNEDVQAARAAGAISQEQLMADFPVRVAYDLISTHPNSNKASLLNAAKSYAVDSDKQEGQKLIQALHARGIDWSAPSRKPATSCGIPHADWKIDGKVAKKILGGETVHLQVSLTNPGPCTLFQAHAISESKNYLLNNHEFLFGKVDANQTLTRDVKIEVPKSMPISSGNFQLTFAEAHGVIPSPLRGSILVDSTDKPTFAFQASLASSSNLVSRNSQLTLGLIVKNIGTIAAQEVSASLKTLQNAPIELKAPRIALGTLKAGEQKEASFHINIPSEFDKDSFDVELTIMDPNFRSYASKKFAFKLFSSDMLRPSKEWVSASRTSPIFAEPDARSWTVGNTRVGSLFQTIAKLGEYSQVRLGPNQIGWVLNSNLRAAQATPTNPKNSIEAVWHQGPKITIDAEKLALEPLHSQFVRIVGSVDDEAGAKDVFVTVNGKKVFYQNLNTTPSKASFDTTIPLEPGLNRVAIVARNTEDLSNQEFFVLQRTTNLAALTNEDYALDPMAQ